MSRIYTSDFRNTEIEIFILYFNVKMDKKKQWVWGLESSCFLSEVAVRLQRHDPRLA